FFQEIQKTKKCINYPHSPLLVYNCGIQFSTRQFIWKLTSPASLFFPLQDYVIRQVYKDRKRKENGETIRKRIIFQPVSSYNRLIESFATRAKGHNQLEVWGSNPRLDIETRT
ncbi:Uncharacterized protein APZ42_001682, partial [Daphnia magna]